jgi:uncharacterized hydrophobic protein (TIGR00271 family)
MILQIFKNVSHKEKNDSIKMLIEHSAPRMDYFLMIILSVAMAAFGLLLNNSIILIGSMLIAPFLYAVLSVSLSIVMSDEKLLAHSLSVMAKSLVVAVFVSVLIGVFFPPEYENSYTLLERTYDRRHLFISVLVAAIAGFAATFSLVKPKLNESLPGVVISASLIPPLAAVGIGISLLNWDIVSGSMLLFLVNVGGIILASSVVLSLFGYYPKRQIAEKAVKEEEKLIKKEKNKK